VFVALSIIVPAGHQTPDLAILKTAVDQQHGAGDYIDKNTRPLPPFCLRELEKFFLLFLS
jgi:hypothetical protein